MALGSAIARFQFQYGTIKRQHQDKLNNDLASFNSNMVRLKVHCKVRKLISLMFQFQYGTIKSGSRYIEQIYAHLFQFQYGTIKSRFLFFRKLNTICFNSNMVRLKVDFV